ncbi:hypothetical protein ACFP1C_04065 [Levilactobacillus fujinensis]|uniref:Uncharacterized protein n=1 Tax=Levilactobacillus fujinensis TaxID=2486024 RepID=A0ABW1TDP2_9LACO
MGLKLGNVAHPSPYRPADMDWIGANTPEPISADLSADVVGLRQHGSCR